MTAPHSISSGCVCPKCKGTGQIEYEITNHGERNDGAKVMTDSLNRNELVCLKWLSKEDGQYGELYGPTLDNLIAKGLVIVGGEETGINNNFIAKGRDIMYRVVSITDAGRAAITSSPTPQIALTDEVLSATARAASKGAAKVQTDARVDPAQKRIPMSATPQAQTGGTKSAPVVRAPHNSGERLPSSDAAAAGAGTITLPFSRWADTIKAASLAISPKGSKELDALAAEIRDYGKL